MVGAASFDLAILAAVVSQTTGYTSSPTLPMPQSESHRPYSPIPTVRRESLGIEAENDGATGGTCTHTLVRMKDLLKLFELPWHKKIPAASLMIGGLLGPLPPTPVARAIQ